MNSRRWYSHVFGCVCVAILAADLTALAQPLYRTLYKGPITECRFVFMRDSLRQAFGVSTGAPNADTEAVQYDFHTNTIGYYSKNCGTEYCVGQTPHTHCQGTNWFDISPHDPQTTVVSTWDEDCCPSPSSYFVRWKGCYVLEVSEGQPWVYRRPIPFATRCVFFHPSDSLVLFQIDNAGLRRATMTGCPSALWNAGSVSWQRIRSATSPAFFQALDDFSTTLYLTAGDTLWRSVDSGKTWNVSIPARVTNLAGLHGWQVQLAPGLLHGNMGLYVSRDSGASFALVSAPEVYAVCADTIDGSIYAGTDGLVYRSVDTGRTWFRYANGFSRKRVIGIAANVYGTVACATTDGLFSLSGPGMAPFLLTPVDHSLAVQPALTLTWDSLAQSTSYRVQVAIDSAFTNVVVDDSGITTTSFALDSLLPLTTYFWRVRASLPAPEHAIWSETWRFTTQPILPSAVTLLAPPNDTTLLETLVEFRWASGGNTVTLYRLEIADDSSLSKGPVYYLGGTDTTTALYEPLIPHTFWWHVRAQNDAGWGPFSATHHFTMLGLSGVAAPVAALTRDVIRIFPDPVRDAATIRVQSASHDVSLALFDALGRELPRETLSQIGGNTFALTTQGMTAGMYVCRATINGVPVMRMMSVVGNRWR